MCLYTRCASKRDVVLLAFHKRSGKEYENILIYHAFSLHMLLVFFSFFQKYESDPTSDPTFSPPFVGNMNFLVTFILHLLMHIKKAQKCSLYSRRASN